MMMMRPPRSSNNESGVLVGGGSGGTITGGGNKVSTAGSGVVAADGAAAAAANTRPFRMSSSSVFANSNNNNNANSRGNHLGVLFFDDQYFPEIMQESSSSPSRMTMSIYQSPISTIIHEIQRTNISAAAAVATVGGGSSGNNATTMWTNITGGGDGDGGGGGGWSSSSSDPWATNHYYSTSWGVGGGGDGDYFYNNIRQQSRGVVDSKTTTSSSSTGADGGGRGEPQQGTAAAATAATTVGNNNIERPIPARRLSSHNLSLRHGGGGRAGTTVVGGGGGGTGGLAVDVFTNPQHALHLLQDTPQLRFVSPQSIDMNGAGASRSGYSGDGAAHHFARHYAMLQRVLLRQDHPTNKDTIISSSRGSGAGGGGGGGGESSSSSYHQTLIRQHANQRAASELASLLWTLAHEMSLEGYGAVESQVLTAVFALVHDTASQENRMAGLAAMDALLAAPSADEERKVIQFANTLSQGLRNGAGDFEFLSAVSKALGHMARGSSNVDFVESEITRALEWLRTDRSDRRLAACLALKEFAIHAPAAFHSKTSQSTLGQGGSNEFLDYIFQAIRDPQPIVRACATDALSQCLEIIVERRHPSLTGLLCQVHFNLMDGLQQDHYASRKKTRPPWAMAQAEAASQHGSLLVVSSMLAYTRNFMLPRYEEVCRSVLAFTDCPKALIRLEVVRLIPRLARRSPRVFGRRYLEQALIFLIDVIESSTSSSSSANVDVRPSAFMAIGELILAMADEATGHLIGGSQLPTVKISSDPDNPQCHRVELSQRGIIHEKLPEVFTLVRKGLEPALRNAPPGQQSSMIRPALHCAANLVDALGDMALPYMPDLIDRMFRAGLSNDLIRCLHSIAQCIPAQQGEIEDRMLQEVSVCLAGVQDVYDPLGSFRSSVLLQTGRSASSPRLDNVQSADAAAETPGVVINMDDDNDTARSLVLSLQTLASFGGRMGRAVSTGTVVPLLPFVQDVVSRYLSHPSNEVRRAAALTCCILLIPHDAAAATRPTGSYSGMLIEDVLSTLLRVAISDSSAIVRLCVVRALDSRYDSYLCQTHHLQELFLLLQDETLATKAASLQLLGRLAAINPAPILPVLRLFLNDLIVELQCGVDTGRGREEATRLLVVFLRAKSLQRLIHPLLSSVVSALPLDGAAPPRLASAALEALGHLALATGIELQPWVNEVVPHVLDIMQDQSSASKQRTSLRTLGQIAGSTGYVIQPYLDYPLLLSHATDILPATKRAPWSLRREVIRTLGILGALDPDRYFAVASKTRKRGAVGGAYFEEMSLPDVQGGGPAVEQTTVKVLSKASELGRKRSRSELPGYLGDGDDDQPASLFMYEQYSMVSQPVSSLPPAKKMTPADEEFYPTVSIQALMRIFNSPGLAVHHGAVIQAIMFIFTSLGLGCVPYLHQVVPHMISMTRTCPSSLRESLFKQLSTLAIIVREHLRTYVADIFEAVEIWWNSRRHLSTIFELVSSIAVGVPDEFRKFVPRLVRRFLTTLDELQVADRAGSNSRSILTRGGEESQKLGLILGNLSSLREVLSPQYLHILVPALLKLADSLASLWTRSDSSLPESSVVELSVSLFRTISVLLDTKSIPLNTWSIGFYMDDRQQTPRSSEGGIASRTVQPIVRIFQEKPPRSPTVGLAMIETLCVCAKQIGGSKWLNLYDGVVRASIVSWQSTFPSSTIGSASLRGDPVLTACIPAYDYVIDDLQLPPHRQHEHRSTVFPFPPNTINSSIGVDAFQAGIAEFGAIGDNLAELNYEQSVTSQLHATLSMSNRPRINQASLQRAWDVSQRASRDDWDEWMRRLAIQLLREAPSPSLRAAASLAQAYQPLSRELFSAAFACCWRELSDRYRANLVHALETAFVADVSPEILQLLLNLAEFMEFDPSGGLPIEISILADLALKCRAYAKALHYREREFIRGGSFTCVESLISINRKLDLQEAALGVLKASSLGERLVSDINVGEQLSTKFARHHVTEMYYSVTAERIGTNDVPQDLTAKQELWLAKLGSWIEALGVYQQKLQRDPRDFEAVLGCMRCFDARGEWRKVLELADQNWQALFGAPSNCQEDSAKVSARSQRKAMRICAQAAWRLGQWDDLEKYSSQLVQGQCTTAMVSGPPATASSRDSYRGWVDFDGAFYSAVLHIHRKEWSHAAEAIDGARSAMDARLTALLAESYSRAYPSMVTCQTLAEMEEIIEYRKIEERYKTGAHRHPTNAPWKNARERLLSVWRDRLKGCRADAEVHASILGVRSLVLKPEEEIDATLKLSELSTQAHKHKFAERVLLDPLAALNANINGAVFGFGVSEALNVRVDFTRFSESPAALGPVIERILLGDLLTIVPNYGAKHDQWSKTLVSEAGGLERLTIQHRLYFAYLKHLWSTGHEEEAMTRLAYLCDVVDMVSHCEGLQDTQLRVAVWLELGEWKISEATSPSSIIPVPLQADALTAFKRATMLPNCGYKAWHTWALLNFRIAQQSKDRDGSGHRLEGSIAHRVSERTLRNHVVAAIKGFANAVSLGTKRETASVQQDLLNLLSCLFRYGSLQDVAHVINECIGAIAIEAWLGVLPQLLARIHIKDPSVRSVLHPLLIRLGEKHPQALMYPLSVLLKSPVFERKHAAEILMSSMRDHSKELVEEALLVSSELIRVAILWLETWHEGLEDASRLYFGEGNVSGMLELLLPLHEKLERGAETSRERDFLKSFGQDLAQAHQHIKDYVRLISEGGTNIPTGPSSQGLDDQGGVRMSRQSEEAETAMNKAWDIYYTVFRRINKQLPSLTKLDLSQCSPALSRARSLELGVPGSYRVDGSYVKIEKFVPNVQVITSKQRPRKITLRGSDGKDYVFLLKGHEDLRQDERVMQLFGLVNALLARDPQTKKHDLSIQRYAISPLSHNCGLVGWVPHCDTFHSLIRDYRSSKRIPLNMENCEMLKIAPDYELLTIMQKVEVFTEALRKTTGQGNDLYEILWLKSTNSEEWLERRTKFTRSLAVMSMVGYILGLGDRHPSNLMLDKLSGRVLHIDFGDCFEVAMNRDKFPERVPFRLTRMLIRAMEVAGIEGSYRSTCERTMTVLRDSRDSLVAMLEAFVYDPLISWRLADLSPGTSMGVGGHANNPSQAQGAAGISSAGVAATDRSRGLSSALSGVPIWEHPGDEDDDHDDGEADITQQPQQQGYQPGEVPVGGPRGTQLSSRARSLQMYQNIQAMAANLSTDSRILSIAAGDRSDAAADMVLEGSMARSRIERTSMRQRELMSLLEDGGAAHEEALNEKALKVIRRVQDKLTGTDFPDSGNGGDHSNSGHGHGGGAVGGDPLDVPDQVQRLIIQATSSENLCQLFIGWCAFW